MRLAFSARLIGTDFNDAFLSDAGKRRPIVVHELFTPTKTTSSNQPRARHWALPKRSRMPSSVRMRAIVRRAQLAQSETRKPQPRRNLINDRIAGKPSDVGMSVRLAVRGKMEISVSQRSRFVHLPISLLVNDSAILLMLCSGTKLVTQRSRGLHVSVPVFSDLCSLRS